MNLAHRHRAAFFALVGGALAGISGLAFLAGSSALLPSVGMLLGLLITVRFAWAAYTRRVPAWMARFFETE
jgi:hypothetical protein